MSKTRNKLGAQGEDIAVRYLKKRGYTILHRNYRCAFGEIDIIARQKKTLVFVEVKTRSTSKYGLPQDAVQPLKQRTICKVALEYIQRHGLEDSAARFDVVAIRIVPEGPCVDVIENAFELTVQ